MSEKDMKINIIFQQLWLYLLCKIILTMKIILQKIKKNYGKNNNKSSFLIKKSEDKYLRQKDLSLKAANG